MLYFCLVISMLFCSFLKASSPDNFDFDIIGNIVYSSHNYKNTNYTQYTDGYNEIDGWILFKGSYWLNQDRSFGPYISVIPSFTTDHHSDWQNNITTRIGLQFYIGSLPTIENLWTQYRFLGLLRTLRFFVDYGYRSYLDTKESDYETNNFRFGLDYYNDNLNNAEERFYISNYTLFVHETTGFTHGSNKVRNFLSFASDTDLGFKIPLGDEMLLIPYITTQVSHRFYNDENWWTNYCRFGGGVKFFPFLNAESSPFGERFAVYLEYVHQVFNFYNDPEDSVEDYDLRIGIEFATQGFFRQTTDSCQAYVVQAE